MTYYLLSNLNGDPTVLARVWLTQLDNAANLTYNGNPQGHLAAGQVGIFCTSIAGDAALYRCTATDGTVGGTTWTLVSFSNSLASHLTPGAVQLATNAQVIAGTDDTTAVTPLGAAATYAPLAGSGGYTALVGRVTTLEGDIGGLAAPSVTVTNNSVPERDGSGVLYANAGSTSTSVVVKSQLDTTNTNVSNLTTLVGTPTSTPTAGDIVLYGTGGVVNVTAATANGQAVEFSQGVTTPTAGKFVKYATGGIINTAPATGAGEAVEYSQWQASISGGGGGSGTVLSSGGGELAYFASTGTVVGGNPNLISSASGGTFSLIVGSLGSAGQLQFRDGSSGATNLKSPAVATGATVILPNCATTFPATQGAAGTVPINNGSGVLTYGATALMVPGGRLCTSSVNPDLDSSSSGSTTLYYLPKEHTFVPVYDATAGYTKIVDIGSGINLSLSSLSATPATYYVYLFLSSGTPTLFIEAATTTNIPVFFNGIRIRQVSSTLFPAYTYLGTFYGSSAGTYDWGQSRCIKNHYNKRLKSSTLSLGQAIPSFTNWLLPITATATSPHATGGASAGSYSCSFVVDAIDPILPKVTVVALVKPTTANFMPGIGFQINTIGSATPTSLYSPLDNYIGAGSPYGAVALTTESKAIVREYKDVVISPSPTHANLCQAFPMEYTDGTHTATFYSGPQSSTFDDGSSPGISVEMWV